MTFLFLNGIIFILFSCSEVNGFFAQLWRMGYQSKNCDDWSPWGSCISTTDVNVVAQLPRACLYNPYIQFYMVTARAGFEAMVHFVRNINRTAIPCGLCHYRISCSNHCRVPEYKRETDIFYSKLERFGGNRYGTTDQLCLDFNQGAPCVMDARYAVNPVNGHCQPWPPLQKWRNRIRKTLPEPRVMHELVYNIRPFNCINVDGKCYCCCIPYYPDPCTGRCTASPKTTQPVLSSWRIRDICLEELPGNLAPPPPASSSDFDIDCIPCRQIQ